MSFFELYFLIKNETHQLITHDFAAKFNPRYARNRWPQGIQCILYSAMIKYWIVRIIRWPKIYLVIANNISIIFSSNQSYKNNKKQIFDADFPSFWFYFYSYLKTMARSFEHLSYQLLWIIFCFSFVLLFAGSHRKGSVSYMFVVLKKLSMEGT